MPAPAEPKFHHYVPRFLLQRFACRERKGQHYVAVIDKHTGRRFSPNVASIMGETHFNRIVLKDGSFFSIESFTAHIDDLAAPVVAKVVEARSLAGLDVEERATLCMFVALQMLRGTGMRNMFVDMAAQLRDKMASLYGEEALPDEIAEAPDEDARKHHGIILALQGIQPYSQILSGKHMILMQPPESETYLLGDNPVVLDNAQPQNTFWGNLGLVSEGIEAYLPLAPTLQLGLWCPSVRHRMREHVASARQDSNQIRALSLIGVGGLRARAAAGHAVIEEKVRYGEAVIQAVEAGAPVTATSPNMQRHNALQINTAERFVVAADEDFSFIETVVGSSQHAKRGRRLSAI
jgi:hypothetical protein